MLIEYVKNELSRTDYSEDLKKAINKLIDVFDKQNHSGYSATVTRSYLKYIIKNPDKYARILEINKNDDYGRAIMDAVKELKDKYDTVSKDMTAEDKGKLSDAFIKLVSFKPLTPLTFEESEWIGPNGEDEIYQNIRNSAVFKIGKDGTPYYLDAYILVDPKGVGYGGALPGEYGGMKCYIKDPKDMPTVVIHVSKGMNKIIDEKDMEELKKHYDLRN